MLHKCDGSDVRVTQGFYITKFIAVGGCTIDLAPRERSLPSPPDELNVITKIVLRKIPDGRHSMASMYISRRGTYRGYVNHAMEKQDLVSLSDLLEYELAPRAELEKRVVDLLKSHVT